MPRFAPSTEPHTTGQRGNGARLYEILRADLMRPAKKTITASRALSSGRPSQPCRCDSQGRRQGPTRFAASPLRPQTLNRNGPHFSEDLRGPRRTPEIRNGGRRYYWLLQDPTNCLQLSICLPTLPISERCQESGSERVALVLRIPFLCNSCRASFWWCAPPEII